MFYFVVFKLILLREFFPEFLEKRKDNILGRRPTIERNEQVLTEVVQNGKGE